MSAPRSRCRQRSESSLPPSPPGEWRDEEKGLRKCRAEDGEENQKQVSHRRPRALGNRCRDFHITRSPGHDRHGKVEIQTQDSHFPTATSLSTNPKKRKEINSSPKPLPSGSSQNWNMLQRPGGPPRPPACGMGVPAIPPLARSASGCVIRMSSISWFQFPAEMLSIAEVPPECGLIEVGTATFEPKNGSYPVA